MARPNPASACVVVGPCTPQHHPSPPSAPCTSLPTPPSAPCTSLPTLVCDTIRARRASPARAPGIQRTAARRARRCRRRPARRKGHRTTTVNRPPSPSTSLGARVAHSASTRTAAAHQRIRGVRTSSACSTSASCDVQRSAATRCVGMSTAAVRRPRCDCHALSAAATTLPSAVHATRRWSTSRAR